MPKFPVEFLPIAQGHPVPQPETAALLSAPKNRPRHALSKAPDPIRPTDRQTTAKALVKTHPPTDNQATAKAPAGAICPQTTRPPPKGSTGTHLPSDNQITAKGPIGTPLSALPPAQYPKRPLPRRQNPPIPQSHDSAPEGHRHLKPHRPFFNHINRSAACKHPLPLLFCRTVR